MQDSAVPYYQLGPCLCIFAHLKNNILPIACKYFTPPLLCDPTNQAIVNLRGTHRRMVLPDRLDDVSHALAKYFPKHGLKLIWKILRKLLRKAQCFLFNQAFEDNTMVTPCEALSLSANCSILILGAGHVLPKDFVIHKLQHLEGKPLLPKR